MSEIEEHRHCQATVLGAQGVAQQGATWGSIDGLKGSLTSLPSGWIDKFQDSENVTEDLAAILTVMNQSAGELYEHLDSEIDGLQTAIGNIQADIDGVKTQVGDLARGLDSTNTRLTNHIQDATERLNDLAASIESLQTDLDDLEGSVGRLETGLTNEAEARDAEDKLLWEAIEDLRRQIAELKRRIGLLTEPRVFCYIAPKAEYFEKQYTVFEKHTDDGTYFTLKGGHSIDGYASYYVDVGGEKRIYPGADDNLEDQYANVDVANDAKKYPVFTLNQALQFLRRFRSSGNTTYYI